MKIDYPVLPLSNLRQAFAAAMGRGSLLLEAEPGAGKSTLAPLWALEETGEAGQIWLIQPRVLPALTLARRLAALTGTEPGTLVGYQIPFDSRQSVATRLLLMTPGVLLQRLLADPELTGVATVMLDEIHERSVNQDTAWALLQEAAILREDLQLVLMSATPDAALRQQVDQSLYSPGRCYPVSVGYCPAKAGTQTGAGRGELLFAHLLRALASESDWDTQTVLVFLPGWRAIEDCRRALAESDRQHPVFCLHSRVDRAEQIAALDPARGPRIILATNIAETSLTIADVTLVVDSGLAREPVFEQRTGVTRLATRRISAASAEQRRGRAGRVQAGRCIRLWAESEVLVPQTLPEIRRTDYLPLVLRLAHWGTPAAQLPWLEPPGSLALVHAQKRLERWGLLGNQGEITALGRQVAGLGTHPRIAALLLHLGAALNQHPWMLLLALALHFDLAVETDLSQWLASAAREYRQNDSWRKLAERWRHQLGLNIGLGNVPLSARVGSLPQALADQLAHVLSDRIGYRTASGRYRLNTDISVTLNCAAEWALVLQLFARGQEYLGVGLEIRLSQDQTRALAETSTALLQIGSGKRRRWVERTCYVMGGQTIDETEAALTDQQIPLAIMQCVRSGGLANLHWPLPALTLLQRARLAGRYGLLDDLPLLSAQDLEARLEDWLAGFLSAETDMAALPLAQGLGFYLGFDTQRVLDRLLPESVMLPSGRSVKVDYLGTAEARALVSGKLEPEPRIAAKLQEFFGRETLGLPAPTVPLAIELLSPAGRPLAITRDLAYFWREVYPAVRRENRGRYAKHPWPENPLDHVATQLVKNRL